MKKTYMIPTMKVVNIKVQNILALSESVSGAQSMSSGSFNTREAGFSDDDWDEE